MPLKYMRLIRKMTTYIPHRTKIHDIYHGGRWQHKETLYSIALQAFFVILIE